MSDAQAVILAYALGLVIIGGYGAAMWWRWSRVNRARRRMEAGEQTRAASGAPIGEGSAGAFGTEAATAPPPCYREGGAAPDEPPAPKGPTPPSATTPRRDGSRSAA